MSKLQNLDLCLHRSDISQNLFHFELMQKRIFFIVEQYVTTIADSKFLSPEQSTCWYYDRHPNFKSIPRHYVENMLQKVFLSGFSERTKIDLTRRTGFSREIVIR